MEKKLLTCLFLILSLSLLISSTARASADNVGWDLQVTNLAGNTLNFSYDQLSTMPQTTVGADLKCYGYPVTSGNWVGVSLSYLLQQAGTDWELASSINFQASDGYQVTIPIEMAMRQNVIVAYEKDDTPLSEGLRLVLPGENGNLWIAMITAISMSTSSATAQSGSNDLRDKIPSDFNTPTQGSTNSTGQSANSPSPSQSPTPSPSPSPTETPTPAMTASLSESASALDYGNTINFTVSTDGGVPPYTFDWYVDGQLTNSSSSPLYSINSLLVGSHHVYVQVTDADGNSATTLTVAFEVLQGSSSSPLPSTSTPSPSPAPVSILGNPLGLSAISVAIVAAIALPVLFLSRRKK